MVREELCEIQWKEKAPTRMEQEKWVSNARLLLTNNQGPFSYNNQNGWKLFFSKIIILNRHFWEIIIPFHYLMLFLRLNRNNPPTIITPLTCSWTTPLSIEHGSVVTSRVDCPLLPLTNHALLRDDNSDNLYYYYLYWRRLQTRGISNVTSINLFISTTKDGRGAWTMLKSQYICWKH